jgi:hypothetical protein
MLASTPSSLAPHQDDYKPRSWDEYGMDELGNWVHLLSKRATHRTNPAKRKKDLYDARNYLNMMDAKLKALELEQQKAEMEAILRERSSVMPALTCAVYEEGVPTLD